MLFTRHLSLLLICLPRTDGQAELNRVIVDYISYRISNNVNVHNACNNSSHVSNEIKVQ